MANNTFFHWHHKIIGSSWWMFGYNFKKNRPEVFCKKGVLKMFAKYIGNTYAGVSFARNFIKKRLQERCLPLNFAKCLRTLFWQNTSVRLLLCLARSFYSRKYNDNFLSVLSFLFFSIGKCIRFDLFKGCVRYILASLFVSLKENTRKTRKNVFYFTLKTLSVLEKIEF